MGKIAPKSPDWLASLLIPGWTQGMYGRTLSGWLFFILIGPAWVVAVMLGWWAVPLALHLLAAWHGALLQANTEPPLIARVPGVNAPLPNHEAK